MYTKNDILNLESFKEMADNEIVKGLFIIKDYSKKSTKTGSFYIDGVLECGGSMMFKAWGNSDAFFSMDNSDFRGKVVYGLCKVNKYGGGVSLILDRVSEADLNDSEVSSSDFYKTDYDGDQYFENLDKLMQKCVDDRTYKIYRLVMGDIEDRFKIEFAAKGHHDNCRSGLVAHTYKVTYMMRMVKFYRDILKHEGNMNLLYLGCALHDIGKIFEYKDGAVVGMGKIVSHHTFGVELLISYKAEIIELSSEEFFYRLLAIVEQHHGEFEETPRTVEAYIIHLIDRFESSLQFLNQKLKDTNKGDQITIDTFKLV